MNSFSLRPRLLILLHKGRQLESLLRETAQAAPVRLEASAPLNRLTATSRTVVSEGPLTLPKIQLQSAAVDIDCSGLGEALSLKNDAVFSLPAVQFQFFPADGSEPIDFDIGAVTGKTFSTGKPLKQLLAFWATVFNCELECYGWQTSVRGPILHIEASLERAGWNLSGTFGDFPLVDFDSREQTSGKTVQCFWGPYRIGEQIFSMDFPWVPTWTDVELKTHVDKLLREQSFPYPWQFKNGFLHLELPTEVLLRKMPPALTSSFHAPFEILPLHLTPQDALAESQASFMLNHHSYALDTTVPVSKWLSILNQQHQLKNVSIDLTEDNKLCFQSLDTTTGIFISNVSSQAQKALGLSAAEIASAASPVQRLTQEWQELVALMTQFLPLLKGSEALQNILQGFLHVAPDSPEDLSTAIALLGGVLAEMNVWMTESESASTHLGLSHSLVYSQSSVTPSEVNGIFDASEKKSEKSRASQFDHKI